jgi:mannose-6-phosphate isomerase-like protein (cupin superfamily)
MSRFFKAGALLLGCIGCVGLAACTNLRGSVGQNGSMRTVELDPRIIDTTDEFRKEFETKGDGFELMREIDAGDPASVEFVRVTDRMKLHKNPTENHILYVLRGEAEGTIGGEVSTLRAGQLVVIPAGVPNELKNVGSGAFEFILFSTPQVTPDDTQWLEDEELER